MTPMQKRVLDFIKDSIRRRGIAPTYDEICAECGIRSKSSAHERVKILQRDGHLIIDPQRPRGIRLPELLEDLVERMLDHIVSEEPHKDRVVVRAQDIADLDIHLSRRRRRAA